MLSYFSNKLPLNGFFKAFPALTAEILINNDNYYAPVPDDDVHSPNNNRAQSPREDDHERTFIALIKCERTKCLEFNNSFPHIRLHSNPH